jgi:hypothetical protein
VRISNVLISDSWGELTPDIFEKGVGGREGAMMYLSREWAKLGHEVTNFVGVERGKKFFEKPRYETLVNLAHPGFHARSSRVPSAAPASRRGTVFDGAGFRPGLGLR